MKIYLDTCVISNYVRSDANIADELALQKISSYAKKGKLTLFSSTVALEEIKKIPEEFRNNHLNKYRTLTTIRGSTAWIDENHQTLETHPNYQILSKILPDKNDARHIWLAKENGIINFITTDKKTILSKSLELKEKSGMYVFNPSGFNKLLHNSF